MKNIFKKISRVNLISLLRLETFQKPLIFVVAIGLVFVLNLLISGFSFRADFSKGQAYSLSQSTKEILRNLDDVVTITFYVSQDLPSQVIPLRTVAQDLLKEYDRASNNLQVRIVDPKRDEKARNEAQAAGIQEMQFSQIEQDRFAMNTGYFGLTVQYGDVTEPVPQISEIGNLEYNLTSAVYKITRTEEIKIGLIGHEDMGIADFNMGFMPQSNDRVSFLREILRQQYAVESINVSTNSATTTIDQSFGAVLIFDDNRKEYDEQEIKAIQDYIANKGKAIFFTDGTWVSEEFGLTTTESKSNLIPLLKQYGITVNNNLILSEAAERVQMGGQGGFSAIQIYPFWLRTNNFSDNAGFFSNIQQMTFPWVSSLTLSSTNGYTTTPLAMTVGRSWEQVENFILMPQDIPTPDASQFKDFNLIARSTKEGGGDLVVVGNSRFVQDQYIERATGNLEFVLNVVNDFASQGALAGIRQRSVNFYPLPQLSRTNQDIFKYANILLLPALFAAYGAFRLVKRK